jgi:DNA-binding transcriptional LysR family regulator
MAQKDEVSSAMDLLQLEHFLAVVEERTFTRAAERVGRTQPAISQSIKKLEDEVGAPLFARDVHEISLTEAGRVLVDYARKMVRARDDAMRDLGSLKALKSGSLNIAAHESAAVYLLPEPLRCYVTRYPDVKIGIFRSRLADIPRQVLDREVDLGFVKDEPGFHDLKWLEVHTDEMICIASPAHPLAARGPIHVRDLDSQHFVVHHLCSSTEQKILKLFEEHATRCRIVAELWSFENIKNFVQAEVGLAIVPRVTVEDELAEGKLAKIPIAELKMPRRTLMVYRDEVYLSDSAR